MQNITFHSSSNDTVLNSPLENTLTKFYINETLHYTKQRNQLRQEKHTYIYTHRTKTHLGLENSSHNESTTC